MTERIELESLTLSQLAKVAGAEVVGQTTVKSDRFFDSEGRTDWQGFVDRIDHQAKSQMPGNANVYLLGHFEETEPKETLGGTSTTVNQEIHYLQFSWKGLRRIRRLKDLTYRV